MPLIVPPTVPRTYQSNLTAAARDGTAITASATPHTKGNYTTLIASTSKPSYGLLIWVQFVGSAATVTSQLIDIAIGAVGLEVVIVPNLNGWGAPGAGTHFFIPIYVPSGSRLSARSQAAIASDAASILVWLYQDVPYPGVISRMKDYGTVLASSRGTPVTPGVNTFGAYAEIVASTIRGHNYWMMALDGLEDTTLAADRYVIEIARGAAGFEQSMGGLFLVRTTASEEIFGVAPPIIYHPVPSGQRIAARLSGPNTEARGLIVYGID